MKSDEDRQSNKQTDRQIENLSNNKKEKRKENCWNVIVEHSVAHIHNYSLCMCSFNSLWINWQFAREFIFCPFFHVIACAKLILLISLHGIVGWKSKNWINHANSVFLNNKHIVLITEAKNDCSKIILN